MQLRSVNITKSSGDDSRVRLVGEVSYDDRPNGPELYWFDVPSRYADLLSTSGNPWLCCLLPLAVTLGEPLRLCRPVDALLLESVFELTQIWKCWFPALKLVPIEAEVMPDSASKIGAKTAAFFSGGVDSWFTVLRHEEGGAANPRRCIQDLLCVRGFDIPLDNREAFQRMLASYERVVSHLGKELIDVGTNLRTTRFRESAWQPHSHGSALAAVGLALEGRYNTLLIASTYSYRSSYPCGSHPLTDPLLSTRHTRVVHDGGAFNRVEKLQTLSRSDLALRTLHVCWRDHSDANCGQCSKCYRTMLTLEVLGALPRCSTFPFRALDLSKVENIYVHGEQYKIFFEEIRQCAADNDRGDVVKAIDQALRSSARIDACIALTERLSGKVIPWRLRHAIKTRLLAHKIT